MDEKIGVRDELEKGQSLNNTEEKIEYYIY